MFLCGKPANDLAHILPKVIISGILQKKENLIILCRNAIINLIIILKFRQQKIEGLYNIAKQINKQAAIKIF